MLQPRLRSPSRTANNKDQGGIMALTFSEMMESIRNAEREIENVDRTISKMATLIAGKLKSSNVWHHDLCVLKRELAKYNMHTRTWKD
jgi:hypothetical protein